MYDGYTDEELALLCKSLNKPVLEELCRRMIPIINKTASYRLKSYSRSSTEAVKDVSQESLIKMHRHIHQFNGESQFKTWIVKIVINACDDFIRREKIRNSQNVTDELLEFQPNAVSDEFEQIVDKLDTKKLLDSLEFESRQIISLKYFKGLTNEEIAEFMKIPIGTVKSRENRARQQLKENLQRAGSNYGVAR